MISYKLLDQKLNEMASLVSRSRDEVSNLETSNRGLLEYWNSSAGAEYYKNTRRDILYIRIVLMAMNTKIGEIREVIKRADAAERFISIILEEM